MTKFHDIPGYLGYRAGSDGSIWTRWNNRWGMGDTWRRLASYQNNKYGRRTCRLRTDSGRFRTRFVHHLVLEAFMGHRPPGAESLHADGNAWNNTSDNLSWGTRTKNLDDFKRHGRKKGINHHRVKLTDTVVSAIRRRADSGETHQSIADSVGVSREAVSKIVRRERWGHVP